MSSQPSQQEILDTRIQEFKDEIAKVKVECSYEAVQKAQEAKRNLKDQFHSMKAIKQNELDKLTSGLPKELLDMVNA